MTKKCHATINRKSVQIGLSNWFYKHVKQFEKQNTHVSKIPHLSLLTAANFLFNFTNYMTLHISKRLEFSKGEVMSFV